MFDPHQPIQVHHRLVGLYALRTEDDESRSPWLDSNQTWDTPSFGDILKGTVVCGQSGDCRAAAEDF